MALTYSQIDAHVRAKYLPILVDNVFVGNPLLVKLMSKNKIMKDSGPTIRVPILYGKKKGGSYGRTDRFDVNPVETRNVAEFSWKANYVNITVMGDDIDMIEGDEKIIGLVENEVKEAELRMKDLLSEQFFADGTGNGGKDFSGMVNAIDNTAGDYGSYGGIDPADLGSTTTNKIWESTVDDSGGSVNVQRVKGWIGECTYGTEVPDLIFTTQTIYDALWNQLQPSQRGLLQTSTLARAGFSGITIDGTQILVDRHCPDGMMLGLNTDYWKLLLHQKKNFVWTEEKRLIDADAYVRQLMVKGNLFTISRRYNFKALDLTA